MKNIPFSLHKTLKGVNQLKEKDVRQASCGWDVLEMTLPGYKLLFL